MRLLCRIMLTALVLLAAASLAGCGEPALEKGSPEAAVQALLVLRSELTTDPAKYASLVETSIAEAIAADSRSRSETQAPTPKWNPPIVTTSTAESADVVVTWEADAKFKDWPKSTVFSLVKTQGRWIVVAATEATASITATPTP